MKVFSVCGISKSGKTTTIEYIVRELIARGYRVGTVKEIHFENFAIDPDPNSNTARHRRAGSELVTARGLYETDMMFSRKLAVREILSFYHGFDYVALEGVSDIPIPTIVTAHGVEDLELKWSDYVFCVSGVIANGKTEYNGVPAISAVSGDTALVDLIERKVYELLPDFESRRCMACGCDCRKLGLKILHGEAKRSDCVADRETELYINGKRVDMVPSILQRALLSVAGELDGYRDGAEIEIKYKAF